ncbi:MAG: signal peptidase II [Gemmatimonadetes bacterium]|nr:signal peptidase II [Gemmatimonadota bacterium]MYE69078.1 signal peptidase II [Gemmatimonadota bacterium]MYJ69707.1 signal peptidase II [Gemmatimonadota bacterium]
MKRKLAMLGVLLPLILIADIITKRWAVNVLQEEVSRPDFMGGYVPLTFALNRGAAFGISIGNDPRWFFIPVALLALGLMIVLMVRARGDDYARTISLSLVIAGALGNLIDRVRWDHGVVDFIGPIDLGFMNWPIFNVADMAISCGAVLLAISFWLEERTLKRAEMKAASAPEMGASS